MSARAEEAAIDQTVADMRFFTENEGKLRLDNYSMSAQFMKLGPELGTGYLESDPIVNQKKMLSL